MEETLNSLIKLTPVCITEVYRNSEAGGLRVSPAVYYWGEGVHLHWLDSP